MRGSYPQRPARFPPSISFVFPVCRDILLIMIDLIKKTVLAGIGATVITKEKVEAAMQDLVKQGKVSAEEAKVFASKLSDDGKKEWEHTSKELGERISQLLAKADYARKAEVEALAARVKVLEEKLAASAKES